MDSSVKYTIEILGLMLIANLGILVKQWIFKASKKETIIVIVLANIFMVIIAIYYYDEWLMWENVKFINPYQPVCQGTVP